MWQLHSHWPFPEREEARQTERVRLESFRVRRLLVSLVVLSTAALAGQLSTRFIAHPTPLSIGLAALGGAAAAVLLVLMPGQAWRVLRRAWIALGVLLRRRAMRRLVGVERAYLSRQAEELPTGRVLCDLAVAEYLRGHLETAEAELAHALEVTPDDDRLLNNLGVVLAQQGQSDRAAELFVSALDNGAYEQAATNCALVAPRVRDPQGLAEMIAHTGHALTPMALNNIAVALALRGEWDAAADRIRQAVAHGPELAPVLANLGLIAYRGEQLQEAADSILQASRQDPNEPLFANYLGVILTATGQLDQARAYLKRAHRIAPASVPIRANLAMVDAAAGHWHVALDGFQALHGAESHQVDVLYNTAVCELAVQDPVQASYSAAAAIEQGDSSAAAYTVLAVALWETGRRAEALSHFQTALEAPGSDALAFSNLARARLLGGDIRGARTVLQRGLSQWPDDPHLQFDAAVTDLATAAERYDETFGATAITNQLSAVQRRYGALHNGLERPDLACEADVNLGLYHYLQEQFEKAAEHFEAALKTMPKQCEISFLIGTALGKASERQTHRTEDGETVPTTVGRDLLRRAIPHLEAATESREVLTQAAHNLGRCLYTLKEYERALAAFRKGIRVEATPELNVMAALAAARRAQHLQFLHRTQLLSEAKRGQLRHTAQELLDVAVHYFRQALLHNELDASLHGNLGIAYMLRNRSHDVEAALRHWERMRVIGGGAMETRYAELAQLENLADPSRVGFDDRKVTLRGLSPLQWLAVPPPRPTGIRPIVEPVAVEQPWRLAASSEPLQQALEWNDTIAAAQVRLRRLRV